MAAPDRSNATIAEILRAPLPDTILSRIKGNAPPKVKESAVKWLNIFHTFVGALTRRITVTEVSLNPDPLENGRILTLIGEIDVTPGNVLV